MGRQHGIDGAEPCLRRDPLRRFISNSTSNRFKAFGVGTFVATLLQSSTATTLIVSSFAARNVITIPGAIAVMLGADVGTTLAAQIMSLNLIWFVPVMLTSGYIVNKTMRRASTSTSAAP